MNTATKEPRKKDIPEGYKRTEVGLIPKDWSCDQLAAVGDVVMGQSPSGSSYNKGGKGVPLINGPTEFTKYTPKKIQWTTQPTKFCKPNDILLCVRGSSTGRINISDDEYCIGRGIGAIRAKANFVNKYLEYQLRNAVNEIISKTSGSTFPNIPGSTLKKIQIPLPPTLEEQRAIAEALSDVDALIAELDALIEKKQQVKKGAMQQLLSGKKRLPGFDDEWEERKLGELLTVMHGKSQKSVASDSGDYPILGTSGQIGKGDQYLYDKPSVLIGRKGTIDRPQYMDEPFWTIDTLFYTHVYERAIAKFLYYRFLLIDWTSYNEASGVPSLNSSTIENIEILCPPKLEEQESIVNILSDMDSEIQALQAKRDKYKKIKQGMMQQLLTGRIRIYGMNG